MNGLHDVPVGPKVGVEVIINSLGHKTVARVGPSSDLTSVLVSEPFSSHL